MLRISVLRAAEERTAQTRAHCAVCETEFKLGAVYASLVVGGYGPDYICERCLSSLCGFARSEDLAVEWREADRVYRDARALHLEPMATHEQMLAMSPEDQLGVYSEAYLTPAPY